MGVQACCKLPMGATPWAMACACRAASSWGAFGMSNLHVKLVFRGLASEAVLCVLVGNQSQPGMCVCVAGAGMSMPSMAACTAEQ